MNEAAPYLEALFGASGDPETLHLLCERAILNHVPAGGRLFASGDVCENFVIVATGQARVQLSTRTGRDIILFRLGPGQSCALTTSCLLSDSPYYAEGVAETDLEIIAIPSTAFHAAMAGSPDLMRRLLGDFAARIAGLTALVDRLTSRDLESELAQLVLAAQDSSGHVALSHKAIADELGTAREVISRKLKELEKAKTVRLGRGSLRIKDAAALQRLVR